MANPEEVKRDQDLPNADLPNEDLPNEDSPNAELPEYLAGLSDDEIVGLIESAFDSNGVGDSNAQGLKARRGLDLLRKAKGVSASVGARLKNLIGAELAGNGPGFPDADRLTKYYSKGTLIGEGRYRLESLIGEGGMGMVWVAEQREPVRRRVALKLIKPGMDSRQVLQRFEAERQALAAMDHPNIARVFDGGLTERDHPFFVMELVNGANLTKFCDEAQLTIRQRLEIFCQIAQAIQHAHHKGVLHRDLKPSNILVTMIDGKPVPKIIDFGLAKVLGSQQESAATGFGMVVGTVEYMAPEQAGYSGQDVDTRADIYSLGVILYELLTGLRPFDSDRIASAAIDEILRIIKTEEPIRPSIRLASSITADSNARFRRTEPYKLTGLLRKELDWVVMKALEKDRNRRYDSAKVLAEDVQRYLAGEPVTAHPPSATYRARKFIGKHRLAVLMASIVLLALLVGMAGIIVGFIKAKQSEGIAIKETQAKENALVEMRDAQAKQEQARRQALQALRSMTDEFMGAEIARESDLSVKDQTFLKNIIRQFDAFANSAAEDVEGRAIRADARVRVGRIYNFLGDQATAETYLREALELWKKLLEADPNEDKYCAGLANCQRSLGSVLVELGQNQEADRLKRAALSYWREASKTNPIRNNQLSYCSSLMDVGGLCFRQLRFEEAEKLYLEAIEILENYIRNPGNRERLASGLNSLATVYEQTGQMEKSKQLRDRSTQLRRRNLRRFSARTEFKEGLARSLVGIGLYALTRGEWSEAVMSYEEAQVIYQGLADQFPSMAEYRMRIADCLYGLGLALEEQGSKAKAMASFAKEIELRETLLDEFSERVESKSSIATLQFTLGRSYAKLHQYQQAESKWVDAIRTREELMQEFSDDQANSVSLSSVYQSLARLHDEMGQTDEAVSNIDIAVRLRREVVKTSPENSVARRQLALSLLAMSRILGNTSQLAQAKSVAQEGREMLQELRKEYPDDFQNKTEFLNGSMDLANLNIKLHDFETAEDLLTQVREMNEQDLSTDANNEQHRKIRRRYLYFQIQVQAAQLNSKLALETAAQLRDLGWNGAKEAFFAACGLARCVPLIASNTQLSDNERKIQSQEFADQAIQLLRQSIELGYGDKESLQHDRDLDPLRERADFQKLIGSFETPTVE